MHTFVSRREVVTSKAATVAGYYRVHRSTLVNDPLCVEWDVKHYYRVDAT